MDMVEYDEKGKMISLSYDEYDGEDVDMSWLDKPTPKEQEKELLKLKESMFIKKDTD